MSDRQIIIDVMFGLLIYQGLSEISGALGKLGVWLLIDRKKKKK